MRGCDSVVVADCGVTLTITGKVICPCLNVRGNVNASSLAECVSYSNNRLVGGQCIATESCPPGQRSVAIIANAVAPGTSCVYYDEAYSSDIWLVLLETKCEGGSPVCRCL
jgi:hypothetical protein